MSKIILTKNSIDELVIIPKFRIARNLYIKSEPVVIDLANEYSAYNKFDDAGKELFSREVLEYYTRLGVVSASLELDGKVADHSDEVSEESANESSDDSESVDDNKPIRQRRNKK